ncbi:MAG: hypothetical protein KDI36_10660, partial [Pseudomonadales bacterium]|nr:hypothetical protein [Pseudomonadales bacterium]
VALSGLLLLAAATGEERWRVQALALVNSFSGLLVASPSAFSYLLTGVETLQRGSRQQVQYGGQGAVRVALESAGRVRISLQPGWHINGPAQPDDEAGLVASVLQAGTETLAVWPEPVLARYAFSDEPVAVYTGEVLLDLPAAFNGELSLKFQACSDSVCLPPDELIFNC